MNTVLRRLLFVFTACLLSVGISSAQTETVRFSSTYMTLGKAMNEIQLQTSYKFAFNISQLDTGTPVRFRASEMTLAEALAQMFNDNRFSYMIRNRFIAVSPSGDNPERANVVARAQDNEPVRIDSIVGRPQIVRPTASGDTIVENRVYEIERTEIIIPPDPVERHYPDPYSAYEPIDRYGSLQTALPAWAVKTNLLYGGLALAPNLGFEVGTGPRSTVELTGSFNDWNRKRTSPDDDNKQLRHWFVRGEYRWWLCQRYNGHFFGVHAFYSKYNVSGYKIPLLFDKGNRYEGYAAGAGATYGYSLPMARRWNLEFHIGVGLAYMDYDKFTCEVCDRDARDTEKYYFGPTRAGISISFMIN